MNTKIVRAAMVSAVMFGMAGCASMSSEELAQLRGDIAAAAATADEAKQMAADTNGTASDAKRTADKAMRTAEEAKRMAADAQEQAAETAEKTERMFKKSMSK